MASSTPPPLRPWRQALQTWTTRRLKPNTSHTLMQRTLYVLPSKAGCMLTITLVVLLMASINFQLNLGYALTFLIAGSALSSLWMGYRNVYGVQMQLGALTPVFQGTRAAIPVMLQAPQRPAHRHGLSLSIHRQQGAWSWVHTDVPSAQTSTMELGFVPAQRGWQRVPHIVVESRFPLGVFRIWSDWQPLVHILVYPAPEAVPPAVQFSDAHETGRSSGHRAGMAEHDGVRSYQRGDPLRSMVWKKAATALATGSGDLVVRDGQQPKTPSLWLDAANTGLADPEAQIGRLTAWVLEAHDQQWRWGLKLPSGAAIEPGTGPQHLHASLAALAIDGLAVFNAT